jgi:hypothetical protein
MFDSFGPNSIKLLPPLPRLLSSLYYVLRYSIARFATKILRSGPKPLFTELQKTMKVFRRANIPTKSGSVAPEPTPRFASPSSSSKTNALERRMNRISQYILEHSTWSFFSPSAQLRDMDDAVSQKLKKLEETYSKVHKAYVPKPYPGKIVLFRATEFPPGYWLEPQLGWGNIPQEGLEIYKIVGNHTSIMESPVLAEKMKACIETAIAAQASQMQLGENQHRCT